jgi:hypothetical protein
LYRAKTDGRNLAFLDQPQEISVSAEEKGLLFGPLLGPDEAGLGGLPMTAPDDAQTERANA